MQANNVCKLSSPLILFFYLIFCTSATAFGQGHIAFIFSMGCFSAVQYVRLGKFSIKLICEELYSAVNSVNENRLYSYKKTNS